MKKQLLKVTYFLQLTEDDLKDLQNGTMIEKMAARDELTDYMAEETWVELKLAKDLAVAAIFQNRTT